MEIVLSVLLGIIGLLIGFLAQRSRMCFVAGFRDFILVRDTELLTGLFSFFLTVWFLSSILFAFHVLKGGIPEYTAPGAGAAASQAAAATAGESGAFRFLYGTADRALPGALFNTFFWVSAAGGWLLGLLSVIAGGCVLRQQTLCAQGNRDALFYLIGFYCAGILFYLFFQKYFAWIYD